MRKLILLLCVVLYTSCTDEPVDNGQWFDVDLPCQGEFVTVTRDTGVSDYEGDLITWLVARDWTDGEKFILTFESCDRETYYGKYIIKMID